jgi:hypothetical protein
MVSSTLRSRMNALDQGAIWLSDALLIIVRRSEVGDPNGLENLSAKTVERLQHIAVRAAAILSGLAGTFLLGIGIFGLAHFLFFSQPYSGSSVYAALATGRVAIAFALLSGILVLLGAAVLQRTFRKENSSWLLPLRVFTYMILSRRQAGGRAGQHPPDTKQHRRV